MTKPKVTKDTCTSGKINNVAAHDGAAPLGFDATIMYANQDPSYHDPDITDCEPVGVSHGMLEHNYANVAERPYRQDTVNFEVTQIVPENDLERAQVAAVMRMITDSLTPMPVAESTVGLFQCLLGEDGTGDKPATLPQDITDTLYAFMRSDASKQKKDDVQFLLNCVPHKEQYSGRIFYMGKKGSLYSHPWNSRENINPRGVKVDEDRPVAIIVAGEISDACADALRFCIHPAYLDQIFYLRGARSCQ